MDFGYKANINGGSSSLGGTIWRDTDGAGVLQPGEMRLGGVTVELWFDSNGDDVADSLIRSGTTDANGDYLFLGLPAGKYEVRVTDAFGVTGTVGGATPIVGPSPTADNNGHTDPSSLVTLAGTGDTDTTTDFAYDLTGSFKISGVVYEDNGGGGPADGKLGTYDGGTIDPPSNNVKVNLYRVVNGVEYLVSSTLTTGSGVNAGVYEFTGLPQGQYIVRVVDVKGTVVDGMQQTGDPDVDPNNCFGLATCDGQASAFTLSDDKTGVDFGYWNGGAVTTPVTLSYVKTRVDGNEMVLTFATVTETGNLGFEAAVERDGQRVKLGEFIPSKVTDSVEPQVYQARLPFQAGDTEYYLTDVSVLGVRVDHGPYKVNTASGSRPTVKTINWQRKAAEKQAREHLRMNLARAASRKAEGNVAETTDLAALNVATAGVQRVSDADLKAAGVDLKGTDKRRIRLLDAAGKNVPVAFEGLVNGKWGANSALSFIGQPREGSLFGTENVYRLRKAKGGALIGSVNGKAANAITPVPWYLESRTVAEQKLYGLSSPNGDPWYQQRMLSRAAEYTLPVELDGLVAGAADIKLALDVWGGTDPSFEGPDHHLRARLNGGAETDVTFDGITQKIVTIDASQAQPGANTLSVKVPGDLGDKTDLINLEGYRVTYPRAFVARDNGLSFSASGGKFQVTGLKTDRVRVYRVGANGDTAFLKGVQVKPDADGRYVATFAGKPGETHTYHVLAGVDAAARPKVEPGVAGADCADGDTDYLAVVHPQFDTPLLDGLLASRSSQGLKVRKVTTDALYAQYSGGLAGPEAIQSCVKAMPKLKHLLLVGSDTSDPNNYLGTGSLSFVPTQYVQTDAIVKFTPSDSSYGLIDGQVKVAVGRLPARDNQELARLLIQTDVFEKKSYARRLVQAADAYDAAQGYDFRKDAQAMAGDLPLGWQVEAVYLDSYRTGVTYDVASAKAALKAGIESGAAMASYVGHSSQGLWSFNKLFSLKDALELDVKGQPTLLTQWGCWNTYFVAPKFDTMAHAFLLGGGKSGAAAAVLGASGLTEAEQETALGKKLYQSLNEPGITLGEALVKAKQSLLTEKPTYRSVVQSWSLLGDPGLVVEK